MKAKDKVVYVPPVYEEVQHEVTSVDDNNNPLRPIYYLQPVGLQLGFSRYASSQDLPLGGGVDSPPVEAL